MFQCHPMWSNPIFKATHIYIIGFLFCYVMMAVYHASGYGGMVPLSPFLLSLSLVFLPAWEERISIRDDAVVYVTSVFGVKRTYPVDSIIVKPGKKYDQVVVRSAGEDMETQFYGCTKDPGNIATTIYQWFGSQKRNQTI